MKKYFLIFGLLILLIPLVNADTCTPDPGYNKCYYSSYSYTYGDCTATVTPKVQINNNVQVDNGRIIGDYVTGNSYIPYKLDAKYHLLYENKVWDVIWDQHSCNSNGCSFTNYEKMLSPEGKYYLTDSVGDTYTDCPVFVAHDHDYVSKASCWAWAEKGHGYGWAKSGNCFNLKQVECYDDSDCASGEICDKSGTWQQWSCIEELHDLEVTSVSVTKNILLEGETATLLIKIKNNLNKEDSVYLDSYLHSPNPQAFVPLREEITIPANGYKELDYQLTPTAQWPKGKYYLELEIKNADKTRIIFSDTYEDLLEVSSISPPPPDDSIWDEIVYFFKSFVEHIKSWFGLVAGASKTTIYVNMGDVVNYEYIYDSDYIIDSDYSDGSVTYLYKTWVMLPKGVDDLTKSINKEAVQMNTVPETMMFSGTINQEADVYFFVLKATNIYNYNTASWGEWQYEIDEDTSKLVQYRFDVPPPPDDSIWDKIINIFSNFWNWLRNLFSG